MEKEEKKRGKKKRSESGDGSTKKKIRPQTAVADGEIPDSQNEAEEEDDSNVDDDDADSDAEDDKKRVFTRIPCPSPIWGVAIVDPKNPEKFPRDCKKLKKLKSKFDNPDEFVKMLDGCKEGKNYVCSKSKLHENCDGKFPKFRDFELHLKDVTRYTCFSCGVTHARRYTQKQKHGKKFPGHLVKGC